MGEYGVSPEIFKPRIGANETDEAIMMPSVSPITFLEARTVRNWLITVCAGIQRLSATLRAKYVRIPSAPARFMQTRDSSMTASESQPFSMAAMCMAYSPLTW